MSLQYRLLDNYLRWHWVRYRFNLRLEFWLPIFFISSVLEYVKVTRDYFERMWMQNQTRLVSALKISTYKFITPLDK